MLPIFTPILKAGICKNGPTLHTHVKFTSNTCTKQPQHTATNHQVTAEPLAWGRGNLRGNPTAQVRTESGTRSLLQMPGAGVGVRAGVACL